jgi:hypothetical protein
MVFFDWKILKENAATETTRVEMYLKEQASAFYRARSQPEKKIRLDDSGF